MPGSSIIVATRPEPRCAITVRAAAKDDVTFIDQLQKMHSHMVGWMPTKQIEANIEGGNIVIAEETVCHSRAGGNPECPESMPRSLDSRLRGNDGTVRPIGYCIAKDQYLKRDDVGIVYQLNVLPLKQRNLIGASLIKAVFDRAAYGCRLFSCWCAQDIQANWFWESIGFVPLAFRTGSRAKQRIHIYWQRRVRDNDGGPGGTPYWFPSQTAGGAVKEDRIVLPIPPGTHWRDAKPLILPGLPVVHAEPAPPDELPKTLPGGALVKPRPETAAGPKVSRSQRAAIVRSQSKHLKGLPAGKAAVVTSGGLRYIERGDYVPEPEKPKPPREKKPRNKNDPKYIAAARELRDRYLEQVNADRLLPSAHGKYDVSRQLEAAPSTLKQTPLLRAA